jgi:hypothetical protein
MNSMQVTNAINSITAVFSAVLGPSSGLQASLAGMVASKLYEAKVLASVLDSLSNAGYTFSVVNGAMSLKASPGPINAGYAYIKIHCGHVHIANLWTDVEFVGLSSSQLAMLSVPSASGEYHELDILICDPSKTAGRPNAGQVYLGVEAKHWAGIPKKLLREILGVRRELSFVGGSSGSPAIQDPQLLQIQRSHPESHLIFAFSTVYPVGKGPVADWKVPAEQFEVNLWHVPV